MDVHRDRCIHDLFEARAAESPDATALVSPSGVVTYAELSRRAGRLARYLRACGVSIDAPVGLSVPRSVETIVALLAILEAGGAYVPLPDEYPRERLAFMMRDVRLRTDSGRCRDALRAAQVRSRPRSTGG